MPGDAVYFDSGTPHSYQCAGKRAAKVIIVTMHQGPAAIPLRATGATAVPRGVTAGAKNDGPEEKSASAL